VLLLDEPLSALDALTRAKLQDELERIWEQDKKTVIMVTNDVDEAVLLADRIIPLGLGPGATLGPDFEVDLPRPRDRTAINTNPAFKRLRAAVTQYLMDIGAQRTASSESERRLPNVSPVTLHPKSAARKLPAAYAKASDSPIESRYVEFFEVRKSYPTPKGPLTVVDGFNLLVNKGEFVSLIGHSGCGKSTLLNILGGLLQSTTGEVFLEGKVVDEPGPDRAIVFQNHSLLPWLTCFQNVYLAVERVFSEKKERLRERTAAALEALVQLKLNKNKK